jgi:hypothetical protein
MAGDHLTRRSVGLSPTHVELIKLLAEIAVDDYLAETKAMDEEDQDEVLR